MTGNATVLLLLYFVLPLWLLAGIADWLCHRATNIAETAGPKESVLHLMMFAEVGLPLLLALFFDINAMVIAVMIVMFFLHEATALWDVSYASDHREVTPIEQHVHSFLEMIPLLAIVCVVTLHWGQFLALFGLGTETADFGLRWKEEPLPATYIVSLLVAVVLLEFLPYIEELVRGLAARRRRRGNAP